jgi:hypothetical protein
MVLYKPSKPYLLSVLDNATCDFGGEYKVRVSAALAAQGLTGLVPAVASGNNGVNSAQPVPTNATLTQATDDQIHVVLCNVLRDKLSETPKWKDGTAFDRHTVEELEERFRVSEHLNWDDIDYAYAYEGAIIPGGKIMMGRWWRLHPNGDERTLEWNDRVSEGEGEGDVDVHMDGTGRYRFVRHERGPFVFWT